MKTYYHLRNLEKKVCGREGFDAMFYAVNDFLCEHDDDVDLITSQPDEERYLNFDKVSLSEKSLRDYFNYLEKEELIDILMTIAKNVKRKERVKIVKEEILK